MKNILLAAAVTVAVTATTFAHPPSDIIVKFDGNLVSIETMHQVKDPKDHYIDEIKVSAGDKKFVHQDHWLQWTPQSQKAVFFIPELVPGMKISVFAECNKFGDLTKEFTVPEASSTTTPAQVQKSTTTAVPVKK
jgi:hypothetical protein